MFQTIELVAEASHDARLHFLLMDVKASLVEGFAGIEKFVVHPSFPDAEDAQVVHEHEVIGTRGSSPPVSSDEGRKGTVVHDAGSCGLEALRPDPSPCSRRARASSLQTRHQGGYDEVTT